MGSADVMDPTKHDDIRFVVEAIAAEDVHLDAEEAYAEDIDIDEAAADDEAIAALPSGIRSHRLYCRQGLSANLAFDDTTFRPATTCEMWTRSAFYSAAGVRLWLSGWRYKGSGNPLNLYGNRWAYRNAAVSRALAIWMTAVSNGQGGWQDIQKWSSWASCS